ncbi:MAG: amidohydrolase [Betaproteobacteria bacterium RIFCSPLOWO2_12_FULL_62_13b]|nr:MAG: amidohydrolase [Betaproteobacteria bacterium RIFCSPLOWO2_12_FULL_62_13b]
MAAGREERLRLIPEEPVEPSLPIVDPHHHLWDRPGDPYLFEEFLQDVNGAGHNVVSTVFVECRAFYRQDGPLEFQSVKETEVVQGIAVRSASGQYGRTGVAAGIVGHVDLTLGAAVSPVLEAHLAASPDRFRGIRHVCTWDASPAMKTPEPRAPRGLILDSSFRAGFACLQKYGLSFDAWLYHPQLPELASLAAAFSETPVILNHLGGVLGVGPYAGKRNEVFQAWKRGLADLVAFPNVVVKLGGLGMPRSGFGWETRPAPPTSSELAEATSPYYLTAIELFGTDRCMFESNFPVDKISYSYGVVWNSFKRMTEKFSQTERAALFHDTAARAYGLPSSIQR